MSLPLPVALPRLTLVLGGARSGKSARAEALVASAMGPAGAVYLATGQAWDAEMAARIAEHRARRGAGWETVEEPRAIAPLLARGFGGRPVLVDCLTLWLSNLMLAAETADPAPACETLASVLSRCPGPLVCVSNELGLGLVPETALGRRFRDAQGRLNQAVAAVADRVEFVAAGLPLVLKPDTRTLR